MVNAGGMGDALRFIPRFSQFFSPRFIFSQSLGNITAVDKMFRIFQVPHPRIYFSKRQTAYYATQKNFLLGHSSADGGLDESSSSSLNDAQLHRPNSGEEYDKTFNLPLAMRKRRTYYSP